MVMQTGWMVTMITGVLGVLGGCVGSNPDWDAEPSGTEEPPPPPVMPEQERCNGAVDGTGGTGDSGDGDGPSDTGPSQEPCRVAEADACGDSGLVTCESDREWFCVDPSHHDEHCGSCFHDCAMYGDASCVDGECYCKGGPWWKLCGEECADTREDPAGCGILCVDCREIHGPNARCEQGVCAPPEGGGDDGDDDDED
jgi:hypothetical protein